VLGMIGQEGSKIGIELVYVTHDMNILFGCHCMGGLRVRGRQHFV
jgi:hypothetical protein